MGGMKQEKWNMQDSGGEGKVRREWEEYYM